MNKRFSAVILALALCMGLAIPTFAADAPHDVDPYTATNSWKDFGDRLISDSKLTINGVIGTETLKVEDFYDTVIFDVVVGGGYTLDMSYPKGRSRYYNIYNSGVLLNKEPWDDAPDTDGLKGADGHFSSEENTKSQHVMTCTEDMVSTPDKELLYLFWLDWGDGPVGSEHTEADGNISFWLRVHPASDAPADPAEPSEPAEPTTPAVSAFTDVKEGAYYTGAVDWAVAHEPAITNGTSETTFEPETTCTQLQILTFLYRAAKTEGAASAGDMAAAQDWAKEKNIIGDDFDGSKDCTRATAVSYIWQAFDKPEADKSEFKDVDAEAAYTAAVDWAVANGVTNGTDMEAGEFSPEDTCTRGQIVTFLHRAYVEEARLTVEK